jgi:hypothetical protein
MNCELCGRDVREVWGAAGGGTVMLVGWHEKPPRHRDLTSVQRRFEAALAIADKRACLLGEFKGDTTEEVLRRLKITAALAGRSWPREEMFIDVSGPGAFIDSPDD